MIGAEPRPRRLWLKAAALWLALVALLAATIIGASLPLGGAGIALALGIAAAQAALVGFVFMGLRGADALIRLTAAAALLFLAAFFALTLAEVTTRTHGEGDWPGPPGGPGASSSVP